MSSIHAIDRSHTSSRKWDKYRGSDILPLWLADMDFAAPPSVLAALHARIEHGVMGYTAAPESLIGAVLEYALRHYSWRIGCHYSTLAEALRRIAPLLQSSGPLCADQMYIY